MHRALKTNVLLGSYFVPSLRCVSLAHTYGRLDARQNHRLSGINVNHSYDTGLQGNSLALLHDMKAKASIYRRI